MLLKKYFAVFFSVYHIRKYRTSAYSTDDANLNHLFKVVSVSFFHCKVTIFLKFILNLAMLCGFQDLRSPTRD